MIGAFRRVWLTGGSNQEAALNPDTNRIGRTIVLQGRNAPIIGVTAGLGRIWLNARRLVAINPRNLRIASFGGAGSISWQDLAGLAVLGHRVWLAAPSGRLIGVPVCWKIYCPA